MTPLGQAGRDTVTHLPTIVISGAIKRTFTGHCAARYFYAVGWVARFTQALSVLASSAGVPSDGQTCAVPVPKGHPNVRAGKSLWAVTSVITRAATHPVLVGSVLDAHTVDELFVGVEIARANARCGARWRARIARRTLDDASTRLAHVHHLIIQLDRIAAKASWAPRIGIAPSGAHRLDLNRWTRGVGRI